MRCFSVMPSRNSMAMKGCPSLLVNFVDRADVGMVQGRSGLSFSLKAAERLRVFGHVVGQELESHERPSSISSALYTTPIPPPPSFSTMR